MPSSLKIQPTQVTIPDGSLVGCRLWGRTESDTTEATSQQRQSVSKSLTFSISVLCRSRKISILKNKKFQIPFFFFLLQLDERHSAMLHFNSHHLFPSMIQHRLKCSSQGQLSQLSNKETCQVTLYSSLYLSKKSSNRKAMCRWLFKQ